MRVFRPSGDGDGAVCTYLPVRVWLGLSAVRRILYFWGLWRSLDVARQTHRRRRSLGGVTLLLGPRVSGSATPAPGGHALRVCTVSGRTRWAKQRVEPDCRTIGCFCMVVVGRPHFWSDRGLRAPVRSGYGAVSRRVALSPGHSDSSNPRLLSRDPLCCAPWTQGRRPPAWTWSRLFGLNEKHPRDGAGPDASLSQTDRRPGVPTMATRLNDVSPKPRSPTGVPPREPTQPRRTRTASIRSSSDPLGSPTMRTK